MSQHASVTAVSSPLPAFEVRQLSFRYDSVRSRPSGGRSAWVINGMDFSVRQGEIIGVIGPNGSGKSSLLKLLTKLVRPQEGTICLFGAELAALSRESISRQVAYMPQDLSFDFPFSVLDLVLMGRFSYRGGGLWNLLGWERREDLAVAEEAMAQTDVTHLASRMIDTLSAGERQRVLLARALAQVPRVLMLDEPTAHLDLNHQLDVCRILHRVHAQLRMTVLLVSHDVNLASQYCDRILVMKQGAVVCIGPPRDVIQPQILTEVYGCQVLVDAHPDTGLPRVSLPAQDRHQTVAASGML
ncbi:MAG: ABC transporter ATP-binding protein [Nitrospirae bacterium]|nr:ABC transporter ATP-binding protein [Nitrospirota bacterium]MDE3049720.1 ABC transporter ATP-binding protein [Nitrospirota bacterium]MDE3218289.1 ABC transporter ATP-binding protein [Nitrospirota bacterium]